MIKKLLILSLIINISCNSPNHILEKEWIIVSNKNLETGEITSSDIRERFRFNNNELRKTSLTTKSVTIRDYELDNNEIKFDSSNGKLRYFANDSLVLEKKNETKSWGKIIEMSEDSLLIKHNNDFVSVYKPLKGTKFSEDEVQKLNAKLIENV